MSVDTVFAAAVEQLAEEQGKDLRSIAHDVMKLSTPDVSVREFRRIMRPDKLGRYRTLSLREAYEFARTFGKSIDDVIAIGILKN